MARRGNKMGCVKTNDPITKKIINRKSELMLLD